MSTRRTPLSWRCYRCHSPGPRRLTSVLCKGCWGALEQSGLRWCSVCKKAIPPSLACTSNHRCLRCQSRMSKRVQEPEGMVPVSQVAARIGFSPSWIARRLNRGWLAGVAVRGPRGAWYLPDWETYPAWEAWKR